MFTLTAAATATDNDLYSYGYFDAAIGFNLPQRPEPAYIKGFEARLVEIYGAPF